MSNQPVGILGIGMYLPPEVRTNDWWPQEVVNGWAKNASFARPPSLDALSPSALRIVAEMAKQRADPFQGSVERHVMPAGMRSSDMEAEAARDAMARARVSPDEIDLLLTHSITPEWQLSNPAAVLHHELKLPTNCFSLQTESSAYTFLHQLTLAEAMIRSGRAKKALLVQSAAGSRLTTPHDSVAPYFGDGATAVVVGPTAGRGLLASTHKTDGRYPDTMVAGTPHGAWYDEGRAILHVREPGKMREVLLQTVDLCTQSVREVLATSGCSAESVSFFCMHQGTPWLRRLAQEDAGLSASASIETFTKTGYLFAAILPLGLRMAEDAGTLGRGDLVMLFGGGTGMTYGATLLEWGPA